MTMSEIRWPDEHVPEGADVHAVNELRTDVAPEDLWPWLASPVLWQRYYRNALRIRHVSGPWPELALGSRFRWITFGVPVETVVEECEPPHRLAWSGRGLGATGHHAWLLKPGRILTAETQRGLAARLLGPALRPQMHRWHQRWCEGLARAAAEGRP